MSGWDVDQVQDFDGHRVQNDCHGVSAEKLVPFDAKGQTNAEEVQARMRICLAHAADAFERRYRSLGQRWLV